MSLEIFTRICGPLDNNTYVLIDRDTYEAVVIDPSFESEVVLEDARQNGWRLTKIWLTHAHFDHFAGVGPITHAFSPPLAFGFHSADLDIWRQGGGALSFGIKIAPPGEPSFHFYHLQKVMVGAATLEVRHTPGHTPGHVIFYSAEDKVAFCGDLIFYHSVGRTDLPGGDWQSLIRSIQTQILTLPPETRLLSGHGIETTVAEEQKNNPFLSQ
jgi:hydroxyacylglutathione hydrolase